MWQPAIYERWIEIDLDVLSENFRKVQQYVKDKNEIIAVVKSDAYGFGAVPAAEAFVAAGAKTLAVTSLEEGIELRRGGITADILVFASVLPGMAEAYFDYNLMPSIGSIAGLKALLEAANSRRLKCHIKINTGMNRLGFQLRNLPHAAEILTGQGVLEVVGLYSHLVAADHGLMIANQRQMQMLAKAAEILRDNGVDGFRMHIANSHAAVKYSELRYGLVRVGSVLYGQAPSVKDYGLVTESPFVLKARVLNIQQAKKGEGVGYGPDYTVPDDMRLASVAVGYADGYGVEPNARPAGVVKTFQEMSRKLGKAALNKNVKKVYYQGKALPAVGRVSMQIMTFDAGGTDLEVGSVVEVPIRKTAANPRLPRVYYKNGEVYAVRDLSGYRKVSAE